MRGYLKGEENGMCRRVMGFIISMTMLPALLAVCHPLDTPQVPTLEAPSTGVPISSPGITIVTEDWPPYNYIEDGRVTGISTEIVQATLAKAEIEAKINVYPWARAYKTALDQKNVLIYTIVRTDEREKLFNWIGPIVPPARFFLYKLKDRTDIVVNSLDDAKKYRIGVIRNSIQHLFLQGQGFEENKQLYPVAQEGQNIEKMFLGRIDFIVENELVLPIRMKKAGLPLSRVEQALMLFEGGEGYYMALSRQTPADMVERMRTAFEQVKAEGLPESITEKYLK